MTETQRKLIEAAKVDTYELYLKQNVFDKEEFNIIVDRIYVNLKMALNEKAIKNDDLDQ